MSDAVYKQFEYLGNEMTRLESQMIDPREFGRLEGAVSAVKAEVDDIKRNQAAMSATLTQILEKLSEAKGGWRLLLALGGAAATAGGGVTWLLTHTFNIAPKP